MQLANIFDQELFRRQVVDGNIEKALDGVGMEVERDHPVRARQLRVRVAGEQLQRARLSGRPLGRQRPGLAHSLADSGLGYCFAAFDGRCLARRRAVYPSTIFISARPIARLPAGTSLVTTVSAAVVASLPTRTGATKIVSHET